MTWPNVAAFMSVLVAVVVPLLTFIRTGRQDKLTEAGSVRADLRDTTNRYNALEDYCYQLRRDLSDAGVPPRPWPANLGGNVPSAQ